MYPTLVEGARGSVFLAKDELYTFGRGYGGALCHGDESDRTFPLAVAGIGKVKQLSCQAMVSFVSSKREMEILTCMLSEIYSDRLGIEGPRQVKNGITILTDSSVRVPALVSLALGKHITQISSWLDFTVFVAREPTGDVAYGFGENYCFQVGVESNP